MDSDTDSNEPNTGAGVKLEGNGERVQAVHSKIFTGGKRMAVTSAGRNDLVYTWTTRSTKPRKDGTKVDAQEDGRTAKHELATGAQRSKAESVYK
ncbi:hypothetical protein Ddc_22189 [Ditylenchus destructor]|nr:hypothetical protein Ddc_22189 [Ditylenchus destructor]